MKLLSAVSPGKNVQYFTGLLYFSKFDKCDVKSHLHKVTGLFLNRPITVAPSEFNRSSSSMGDSNRSVKELAC